MFDDTRAGAPGLPPEPTDPFPTSPSTPPRRASAPVVQPGHGWIIEGTPRTGVTLPSPRSQATPMAPQSPGRAAPAPVLQDRAGPTGRPKAPPPLQPPAAAEGLPAEDPAPRRSRTGSRLLAGVLALAVPIAFVMIGVLALGGGGGGGQDSAEQDSSDPLNTPQATSSTFSSTSRPSREARPEPGTIAPTANEPGPRAWELPATSWDPLPTLAAPDEHWEALQQSPVNALPAVVLTGCPEPATVTTEPEYRDTVRAQWDCVHAAWVPVYEALGWSTVTPAVEFYPGTGSKSECGYLEAPAFYCSAGTGTAYFGGDHLEMARSWDLSVNEMVNHEYGHHIQSLAGITTAKQHIVGTDDVERRSELQATCWAAMMTYNNRSFDFTQEHYDGWQRRIETMLVDGVHGSRESLRYWGTRGLYATTLGDCNTWLVESEHVS